jgi:hypothetical protein
MKMFKRRGGTKAIQIAAELSWLMRWEFTERPRDLEKTPSTSTAIPTF